MTLVDLGMPKVRRSGLDPARPEDHRLVDRFGRVATDLRVSLTDRCNLRCTYCMPEEGLDWMHRDDVLTDREVVRLIRIAVGELGIKEVRFTGGEPLLRRGLESIVSAVSQIRPRPRMSLTTNGIGLEHRASGLALAGLDRVNVSLDTLQPERFVAIARRDRIADVLLKMTQKEELYRQQSGDGYVYKDSPFNEGPRTPNAADQPPQ